MVFQAGNGLLQYLRTRFGAHSFGVCKALRILSSFELGSARQSPKWRCKEM